MTNRSSLTPSRINSPTPSRPPHRQSCRCRAAGVPPAASCTLTTWSLTTVRALGREDGLHVRRHDGRALDAELAGWDPTTSLAVLRVAGLGAAPSRRRAAPPRVGHLALAVARSWSNVVTASAGIVSVIGGPLPTGRRRAIDEVIRTTAPMHDGFAGGAFLDTGGRAGRHRHSRSHSWSRHRHSRADRVEDGGDRPRARQPEARIPRARRSAGGAARESARDRTAASRRCWSSA